MLNQDIYAENKLNYVELKNVNALNEGMIQIGGKKRISSDRKIIIHISGPSGAGKTTLGEKLKEKYGDQIVVKDIDDLRDECTDEIYGGEYDWDHAVFQSYIDRYIEKQKKPLVFVGLSTSPWRVIGERVYYDMHADYNFYIDIDDMMVVKQKCTRFVIDGLPRIIKSEPMIDSLINDNESAVRVLKNYVDLACGKKEILEDTKIWNEDYKKHGYKFMSSDKIFNKVTKILNKLLNK